MTTVPRHVDDRIDDWLDGRLGEVERRQLEAHCAGCERCRSIRDGLVAVRAALRARDAATASPPSAVELEARLGGWLDREDAEIHSAEPHRTPRGRRAMAPGGRVLRFAAAAALSAVALATAHYLATSGERREDPVVEAFRSYAELPETELPAALAASEASAVESRWRRSPLGFPARVLDLSAMGIELAGGDAVRLASAPAVRSIYRAAPGWIVCWMFEAVAAPAWTPSAERRQTVGFDFEVHRRPGVTLVLWREGDVVCMLLGGGDPEQVIALAKAKAMAPVTAGIASSSRADSET